MISRTSFRCHTRVPRILDVSFLTRTYSLWRVTLFIKYGAQLPPRGSSRIAMHSCVHFVSPAAICIRMQYNFLGISELYKRQTRWRLYAAFVLAQNSSCKKEPQYDVNVKDAFITSLGTYVDIQDNCIVTCFTKIYGFFRLCLSRWREQYRVKDAFRFVPPIDVPLYPNDHLWIILSKLPRAHDGSSRGRLASCRDFSWIFLSRGLPKCISPNHLHRRYGQRTFRIRRVFRVITVIGRFPLKLIHTKANSAERIHVSLILVARKCLITEDTHFFAECALGGPRTYHCRCTPKRTTHAPTNARTHARVSVSQTPGVNRDVASVASADRVSK